MSEYTEMKGALARASLEIDAPVHTDKSIALAQVEALIAIAYALIRIGDRT